jgi:hypothetical protein
MILLPGIGCLLNHHETIFDDLAKRDPNRWLRKEAKFKARECGARLIVRRSDCGRSATPKLGHFTKPSRLNNGLLVPATVALQIDRHGNAADMGRVGLICTSKR